VADWIVMDQNYVHAAQLYIAGAVHHALASNNVLDFEGTNQIGVRPFDPDFSDRSMSDITITHNTGLNNGTNGSFLEVTGSGAKGVLTLTDNLFVAPNLLSGANMSGGVVVMAPDLSVFNTVSGNVWPAPSGINHSAPAAVNYAGTAMYGDDWLSPDQWNAQAAVKSDTFKDVTLPEGIYQLSLPAGVVGAIGSIPARAAA
jgi:hypothetical protein